MVFHINAVMIQEIQTLNIIACKWDVRFLMYMLGTVCGQHIHRSWIWRSVLSVIGVHKVLEYGPHAVFFDDSHTLGYNQLSSSNLVSISWTDRCCLHLNRKRAKSISRFEQNRMLKSLVRTSPIFYTEQDRIEKNESLSGVTKLGLG